MSAADIPNPPFGEIALSLSGGGYRAAGFHLGVLDLLHRLELLQDVRVLSTVSGGTFTGMMYSVNAAEGGAFEDFYDKLYSFLSQLEDNKNAFTTEFVQRSRFTTALPTSMTPAQFVDKLNQNAGNPLSPSERDQLVSDLTGGAKTRDSGVAGGGRRSGLK